MTCFEVGDRVTVKYTDALGHTVVYEGNIHHGPLGEDELYWYVKLAGVAVLFSEKDIEKVADS